VTFGLTDQSLDPHLVTYHRHRARLPIELVDRVLVPAMERPVGGVCRARRMC
jgi:hypothetical protein